MPGTPGSNMQYIVAVVVMSTLGVIAVTLITFLRPSQDNTALIGTILGMLAPTTLSLLALMKAQETHLSVNSRLDTLLDTERRASHAEGVEEGRQKRSPAV